MLLELLLEVVDGSELVDDGLAQVACGLVVGCGSGELCEVEFVVEDLPCVVLYCAGGCAYYLAQCLCGVWCAREQGVEVVDVCLQVLAVVYAECLWADGWLQCVDGVGKGDEGEGVM